MINSTNNSTTLQCWIVRNSALSIMFGGLERLFVHFSKPIFYHKSIKNGTGDLPFSEPTQKCGLYKEAGWEGRHKIWVNPLSVGNWIGYDSEISSFIWEKLCEHFKNEPMENWEELEKSGIVKREDFCLELDLNLSINFGTDEK